jgi:malonate-semialdehyde dehydrogenase (acetylating)/methylmalonate-semialdehyde dehydrogenase
MSSLFSSFRSVQRVPCPTIHRPSSRVGKVSFLSSQSWLTESSSSVGVPVVTNLIRGTFSSSLSSPADYLPVIDPSKNEILRYTPQSTQAEIKDAIIAASEAFPTWKATPIQQRQRIMFQYQHLIRANMDRLMHIITLENGKTLADAKGDILRGLEIVETCCDMAHRLMGENLMGISDGMDCMSYRVPLGVCAGIGR